MENWKTVENLYRSHLFNENYGIIYNIHFSMFNFQMVKECVSKLFKVVEPIENGFKT